MTTAALDAYITDLAGALRATQVTPYAGDVVANLVSLFRDTSARGNKVILVGNGGSAAIASHISVDLNKCAGVRAMALNDAATLTALSNDHGYETVFAHQIEWHGRPGDILVAVSSSGKSESILNAVWVAKKTNDMYTVTLSGFRSDNPLRGLGDLNFYVPSDRYGIVETVHQTILHCVADQCVTA